MRGRVLAIDGRTALLRCADGDVEVDSDPAWCPGDLVDTGLGRHYVSHRRGDYPTPTCEVARLSRSRLRNLEHRAAALSAVRSFFAARGFLEVETPLLVRTPGLELHLDPIAAGGGWLITSPEYQMKRLLAAGLERIYQVCRCFRGNEHGDHHSSEFTMIEWYRSWAELPAIATDLAKLVAATCTAVFGKPEARLGERHVDVTPPWPEMTVREAMNRWARIDVVGDESIDQLRAKVESAGVELGGAGPRALGWDDLFFSAWVARVDPALAQIEHPLLVTDWPAPLAALAKRRTDNPSVAHRFEAYVLGLELGNAFGELTDAAEQRARFESDVATRQQRGRGAFPVDEKLLEALAEGLPPSAGIAVGFDRLCMLAAGAERIQDVLAFDATEL